jgi:hypothetical protein
VPGCPNFWRGPLQKFNGMTYMDATGSLQLLNITKAEGQAPLFFEYYKSSIDEVGERVVQEAIAAKPKDPKAYEKVQELVLRKLQIAAWRQAAEMAVLLEMYRTAMVTTVPCEAVFSVLKNIRGEHRTNITTELLAMQLVLNLGPSEEDAVPIVRKACDKFLSKPRRSYRAQQLGADLTKLFCDEVAECEEAITKAVGWHAPDFADDGLRAGALDTAFAAAQKTCVADMERAKYVASTRPWQLKASKATDAKDAKKEGDSTLPEPPYKKLKAAPASKADTSKMPTIEPIAQGADTPSSLLGAMGKPTTKSASVSAVGVEGNSSSSSSVASKATASGSAASSQSVVSAKKGDAGASSGGSAGSAKVPAHCKKVILVHTGLSSKTKLVAKTKQLFEEDLNVLSHSSDELKGQVAEWWAVMLWGKQKTKNETLFKWVRDQLGSFQDASQHERLQWIKKALERMRARDDRYYPPPIPRKKHSS